jgi:hypothetical protein
MIMLLLLPCFPCCPAALLLLLLVYTPVISAAMDANLALLRRSLCANPWLAQRISLFGTGQCQFTDVLSH